MKLHLPSTLSPHWQSQGSGTRKTSASTLPTADSVDDRRLHVEKFLAATPRSVAKNKPRSLETTLCSTSNSKLLRYRVHLMFGLFIVWNILDLKNPGFARVWLGGRGHL
jgi:hypothetical protein